MKKLLLSVFFIALALVLLAQQDVLWSRLLFLDAPRVHVVQKGESLSRLAQKNYGDTDYWRELALINRAPKPDHIQPGEEVLLPAANVIHELRRARTISRVNDLINEQESLATRSAPASQQVETQPAPATNDAPGQTQPEQSPSTAEQSSSTAPSAGAETAPSDPTRYAVEYPAPEEPTPSDGGSSWFWLIFGLLALGGVIGFVVYRRRQEEEEIARRQEEKLRSSDEIRQREEKRNFQMDRRPHTSNKAENATA